MRKPRKSPTREQIPDWPPVTVSAGFAAVAAGTPEVLGVAPAQAAWPPTVPTGAFTPQLAAAPAAESASADGPPVAPEDVARNLGSARFSISGRGWRSLRPDLPADMIALLAPPVLVSAVAFPSAPPPIPGRHRRD